jgi:predicted signal transduction protein with EAL and GGDEF domain
LQQTTESAAPGWLQSPPEVRLLRLRLRLALLTMAIVPIILVWMVAGSSLAAFVGGAALPVEPLALMVSVAALLVVLAIWVSRQVLRPVEALEKSRAELIALYESAKADSLRDPLTGLGNHRAFQEELDRQLEWYRRYKVPVALLMIDIDDI